MRLIVKAVEQIIEIEPAIFELVVTLEDGSPASVQMCAVTMRLLIGQMVSQTIA